jgi:hypothetical protein
MQNVREEFAGNTSCTHTFFITYIVLFLIYLDFSYKSNEHDYAY